MNFANRSVFGEVMGKSLVSCFFDSQCRLAKCCHASIFALAAKFHIDDVVRSNVARIKDSFCFHFSKLLYSVLCLFVSFCVFYRVRFIAYFLFMLHSCVLNWWGWRFRRTRRWKMTVSTHASRPTHLATFHQAQGSSSDVCNLGTTLSSCSFISLICLIFNLIFIFVFNVIFNI